MAQCSLSRPRASSRGSGGGTQGLILRASLSSHSLFLLAGLSRAAGPSTQLDDPAHLKILKERWRTPLSQWRTSKQSLEPAQLAERRTMGPARSVRARHRHAVSQPVVLGAVCHANHVRVPVHKEYHY